MSIRDQVLMIIRAVADNPADPLTESTSIPGLGIDSLRLMEMVLNIEDTCGIEFSDSDLMPSSLATVGALLATVERLKN